MVDAYVFVTPEYNHNTSGALKNGLALLVRLDLNLCHGRATVHYSC